jgi:GNAT superfamily N-acetyltransferase
MKSTHTQNLLVRAVRVDEDFAQLTAIIRAAYAPHATQGLRYWGTHQSVDDTQKRLASGIGLIAEVDGKLAGTITLRAPQPNSEVPLYRNAKTWSICQFAVAPAHKGFGVGAALHRRAVELARANGAAVLALDTAAPAAALIAKYAAWGYVKCGECDWRPHTNYLSTLMSLDLMPPTIA